MSKQEQQAGTGPVERTVRPLPKVGPVCFADAQSILEYKVPAVGRHLPGVLDVGLWTSDQMRAYADAAATEERAKWEAALKQTWQMIDPLRPSGVPDSLLTILGVPAERCRSEGGNLIPRKVLTLMGETRADDVADAVRFRWMCRYPDWHFIEHLCNQTNASTSTEFLADLRRVIDARRSVELGPFDEHMPPDDLAWERKADSSS